MVTKPAQLFTGLRRDGHTTLADEDPEHANLYASLGCAHGIVIISAVHYAGCLGSFA